MTNSNSGNSMLKGLIALLAVLLVALTIFTIKLHKDSQQNTAILEKEKHEIEEELEEMIGEYDVLLSEHEGQSDELEDARNRIEVLLDSVKDSEANLELIQRYRWEVGKLKTERDELFRRVDSLQQYASRLEMDRDSILMRQDSIVRQADSVYVEYEAISQAYERGAALRISSLKPEGVFTRSSGKVVATSRSRRAEGIRACFTINPNAIAESGDKQLYIQVLDPNNNIIGERANVMFEQGELIHSASSTVFYENEALDVCIIANEGQGNLAAGNYTVTVFEGPRLLDRASFTLK